MPIDEKALQRLLSAEQVQPGRCAPDLWDRGEQVLRLAGPRSWMIESFVREASEKAGIPMDWHFAGGRAVVLALPEHKEKAIAALALLMPTFETAAQMAIHRKDADAYPVQILDWGGNRPPKPEEFPKDAMGWDPVLNAFIMKDRSHEPH